MEKVVFVAAKRTPIGKLGGSLSSLSAVQLGALTIHAALSQSTVASDQVDEVFFGNVLQAGNGQNPARQASIKAGLPLAVPATTINDVCGSGMQAIRLGAMSIMTGQNQVVVAGGMESMSNAPYLLPKARFGYRFGNGELVDSLYHDGLEDAFYHYPMGKTAENMLEEHPIARARLDRFSLRSHQLAAKAQKNGLFTHEIVPVHITDRHGQVTVIAEDENIRQTDMDQLGKLKPVFKEDGQVTAGNSSSLNDGAAAVVMTSETYAHDHQLTILGYLRKTSIVGVDPQIMGIGPLPASQKLLRQQKLSIDQIDYLELNEAFAVSSLIVIDKLGIDLAQVNPHGGAIALGHPLGASGARIIVTLLNELQQNNAHRGLASLCIGGGMGAACLIER